MTTADEKYVALTTFTRSGHRKVTPVWIVDVAGDLGFTTAADAWKLKRLRNDPRCELQPCDARGGVREGSLIVTGKGREASADELAVIKEAVAEKYGLTVKLINAAQRLGSTVRRKPQRVTTGIVISLD